MKKKVLIIGLDGATWDVLDPLIEGGHMPNLEKFIKKGKRAVLKSTIPPVTAPAWSTFQTGVGPGEHGIYDFSFLDPGTKELDLVDSGFLKEETIWEKAAKAGKKVITINVPLTYPPKEVPGWIQVGGPLSGTCSPRFVYPEEIYEEVKRFDYEVSASGLEVRENNTLSEAVNRLIEVERKRYDLAKHFLENKEWDLFMIHNQVMDTIQHAFFHYLDFDDEKTKKERKEIVRFYNFCDREIGKLVELAGSDAGIIILSDHGFKRIKRLINLNIFLKKEGYLALSHKYFFKRFINIARKFDIFNLEEKIIEGLVLRNKGLRKKLFSFGNDFINWEKSKAFMGPGSIYGNVYVKDGKLKEEIKEKLEGLEDSKNDKRVIKNVWRKEEVFEGPCLKTLPDLIIQPEKGYSFKTNLLLRETKLFRDVDPQKDSTGTHVKKGIVIFEKDREKSFQEVGIKDMACYILGCLDLSTAEDTDEKGLNLSPNRL